MDDDQHKKDAGTKTPPDAPKKPQDPEKMPEAPAAAPDKK
jgi:hypothetical protein